MAKGQFNIDVPVSEFVDTDQDAAELLRLCLRKIEVDPNDFIGWDTETHGRKIPIESKPLDWMNDTVTFWSLSFALREGGEPHYRRWCLRQEHFHFFSPFLENPGFNIAGWNLKYDAHIAWNCRINIWNSRRPVDGLVLAQLHDENRNSHGLKTCAEDWVGLQMTPYKSLFDGIRDASGKKAKEYETSLLELVQLGHQDKVADYASYDAFAHLKTVEWLIERLKETPVNENKSLWQYFLETEMYVTELLWRMERRGLYIDREYLRSKLPELNRRLAEIENDINRDSARPLNLDSPKQLAAYFFGKEPGQLGLKPIKMTATNQPSTDAEVMDALAEAGVPVAKKVLEARSLGKTKSTYIEALLHLADYFDDKRIHPNFNQLGARTGRLSTSTPNSQNFPRPDNDEWGIRRAFIAPPGKKLLVGDYEQVEMRIMADFSGDEKMIGAIRAGKDLHSFTVALMEPGVNYEEVVAAKKAEHPTDRQKKLKTLRQEKKAVGFGIIYGAGPPKISTAIEISEQEWKQKLSEMDDETFERRVIRLMERNPLLTQDQAIEQVGRHSVAGQKISDYFAAFPGVKAFMDATPQQCRYRMEYRSHSNGKNEEIDWTLDERIPGAKQTSISGHFKPFGYVQTLSGRYRRLEDIAHKNYFYRSEAERQAINTRIQGTAADIAKQAMLRIDGCPILNKLGVLILNQVHDEIVMEVPEESAEQAKGIVRQYMEHPFGDDVEALCVSIPVDLKIVGCWADAK